MTMDRDELELHEAATRQGLSLWRNDDGTWGVQAKPNVEPLGVDPVEVDTFIGDGMIRLADGRTFPLRMTTDELRLALANREESQG
jgi:hypothetical protein